MKSKFIKVIGYLLSVCLAVFPYVVDGQPSFLFFGELHIPEEHTINLG